MELDIVIKNMFDVFGTRIFASISGLLVYIAIARVLGPELQGIVSFSVMFTGILVVVAGLGLDSTAVYFLNNKRVKINIYIRQILPLLIISSILVLFVLIVATATGIMDTKNGVGRLSNAIYIATILIPLDIFLQIVRSLVLSLERFDDLNGIERRLSVFLIVLVGISLAFNPESASIVLVAYVVDRLFVIGWILFRLRRKPLLSDGQAGVTPSRLEILRYSVFPWMGNALTLIVSRLDMVILAWYIARSSKLNPTDLGLYTICMMAISRIQDAQAAIQNVFNPRVATMQIDEARKLTARFYRLSWIVYLGIFIILVVGGIPVLNIFGQKYTQAYPILMILAFGSLIVRANVGILALFFTFTGRPQIPFRANLIAALVSFLLLNMLVPEYGAIGAALCSVVACIVLKLYLILEYRRDGGTYRKQLILSLTDLREFSHILCDQARNTLQKLGIRPETRDNA